jgi:hypothetical protein
MIVSILLAGENRRIEMAQVVDNVNGRDRLDSAPTEIAGTVEGRPTREQIAVLAHHLWQERKEQDGYSEQDWLRAEEQLQKAAS